MDLGKSKKRSQTKRLASETDQNFPTIARLIRLTNLDFYRCLQAGLSQFGLAGGMWHFLHALARNDGVTVQELSHTVETTAPTTVVQIDRMEALGLIERKKSPSDKRKILIFLTPYGRKLYRKVFPVAGNLTEAAIKGFTAAEVQQLRKLLGRVQNNLETHLKFILDEISEE